MKQLRTDIEIEASPEQVWAVVSDIERYREWNPFITEARGVVEPGAKLRVHLAPPGGRGVTMRPQITQVEPGRAFEWFGRLLVPGLFDGRHRFELERIATGTRLTQRETFTGMLVPLLARSLDTHTLAGFELMNRALAARVEQMHSVAPGG